jgi:hypothetical protein
LVTRRIAVVIAAFLLAAAAIATLAPSTALGTSCGTWAAPQYDIDRVAKLIARGKETAADLDALGGDGSDLASAGNALAVVAIQCDDQLAGRRLLALVLLALALAAPGAIIYIGRARTRAPVSV